VEVIPNGLDTDKFAPKDKMVCREFLGLPQDRPIILYGAVNCISDPNKGWHLLQPALQIVGKGLPDAVAVVFGCAKPEVMQESGMEVVFLGPLQDEGLVAAYSAADVFVAPSLQESFCQTVVEAMACATPAVAFGATGPLEIIEHQLSGYLAQPYEVADLARGIVWILADRDRHARLAAAARNKVIRDFALEKVSQRYIDLYREVLAATTETIKNRQGGMGASE
jgi:glycosyltransferase involved in cell wall biosynthesis